MSKTVRLTYFGMDGKGATLTEAKKDAGKKIEAVLHDVFSGPVLLEHRGHACILVRGLYGWEKHTILRPGEPLKLNPCHSQGGPDLAWELHWARLNLAQNAWALEDGLDPPEILEGDERLIGEHRSWVGFQLAYQAATKDGRGDTEAHRWACDNGWKYSKEADAAA